MKILNIAEKPSVAKSISNILSSNVSKRQSQNKYIPVYSFRYENDEFIFTSVLGHLTQTDFTDTRKWDEFDPKDLFTLPIETKVVDFSIKKNLLNFSQNVDKVIIWTDCDREGEHIALEIKELIKHKNIKRARFFAITRSEIINSLNNLVEINEKEANAVKARIELDLRIGAAFTRLQTLALKRGVISYGSCQVPTLGFVVERNEIIKNFIAEDFFSLSLLIKKERENIFKWQKGNFFDENFVTLFYAALNEEIFKVYKVETKEVKKLKPYPLRTVEFQKKCASILKISPDRAMKIAEDLYNKGYISYPRTETDSYPFNFDFKKILGKLSSEEIYKNFSEFEKPRRGRNNDLAHLPIYPLKAGVNLTPEEKSVYDLVVKYFLAGCSKDAVGEETKVTLVSTKNVKEFFILEGLRILERNYLNIFTFDKWEEKNISTFVINEVFYPSKENMSLNKTFNLEKTKGKTTPPQPMTESELISLMDKNGIGTDSTIHEHIKKIQVRKYAYKKNSYIFPTKLGTCLIKGYNIFDLEFSTPKLRAELELKLKAIEKGEILFQNVIKEELKIYEKYFLILQRGIDSFKGTFENEENNFDDDFSDDNSNNDDNENKGNNNITKFIDLTKKDKKTQKKDSKKNDSNENYKSETKKIKKNNQITITKKDEEYKPPLLNESDINEIIKIKRLKCNCGKPPKHAVVKKDSANSGKTFFFCGNFPKKCKFFLWFDELDNYRVLSDIKIDVKCECGFEPKAEISRSENNKGKIYLKCKKLYKPCKFFSWMD